MEGSKTSGSKHALQTMLYYYLSSLLGSVDDPKQFIVQDIADMLDLSEDQVLYVKNHLTSGSKFIDNIDSCIQLLDGIMDSKQLDLESISIVRNVLSLILKQSKDIINTLEIEEIQNG